MAGLECKRRLWLLVNRPEAKRAPNASEQRRMRLGLAFGARVRDLFPGGELITASFSEPEQALEQTSVALAGSAPALFEAAFVHQDVLVRVDVLRRSATNVAAWDIIEVKSASNSIGRESDRRQKLKKHVSDMAVQLHVAEGAGVEVASAHLAWVNSAYERAGPLDWNELVAVEDHSDAVRDRFVGLSAEVDDQLDVVGQAEMPDASFGKTKCNECSFLKMCWGDEPKDSVIHLPRISAAKLAALADAGVRRIPDISSDFKLSPTQKRVREAFDHPGGLVVDRDSLEAWLGDLVYPIHFLDFETWGPCIPPFDGIRPYQQIPFQYSLHIQDDLGGALRHCDFVATAEGDPRPGLIEQLVVDLGAKGSIVVHHAGFEADRLRELAELSAVHRDALLAMIDRLADSEKPFKEDWYSHPALLGKSSIKVVLPVLAPEFGYDDLAIGDGMTAAYAFEDMYEGRVDGEEGERVREALSAYCRMDTLAMVKIVERLRVLLGETRAK